MSSGPDRDKALQNQPSYLFQNQYADDALHQEGNVSGGVGYYTFNSSSIPESWHIDPPPSVPKDLHNGPSSNPIVSDNVYAPGAYHQLGNVSKGAAFYDADFPDLPQRHTRGIHSDPPDMSQSTDNNHPTQYQAIYRNRYAPGAVHQQGNVNGGVGYFKLPWRPKRHAAGLDPLQQQTPISQVNNPDHLDSRSPFFPVPLWAQPPSTSSNSGLPAPTPNSEHPQSGPPEISHTASNSESSSSALAIQTHNGCLGSSASSNSSLQVQVQADPTFPGSSVFLAPPPYEERSEPNQPKISPSSSSAESPSSPLLTIGLLASPEVDKIEEPAFRLQQIPIQITELKGDNAFPPQAPNAPNNAQHVPVSPLAVFENAILSLGMLVYILFYSAWYALWKLIYGAPEEQKAKKS